MLVNAANITNLGVGFNAAFRQGLTSVQNPDFSRIATVVPSTTAKEQYGWLGGWPEIREWLGDRQAKQMEVFDYTLKNRDFEATISVKRNDLADDNLGLYAPLFQTLGNRTANFPNKMVFQCVHDGRTSLCFDGQPFFDTDHPVTNSDGVTATRSNWGGGGGTVWYLLVTGMPLKPFLYQERQAFQFVALDKPDDDAAFKRKEFLYGVDGRANAGYGFWQLAYASGQDLTADNVLAAIASMAANLVDAEGEPLGLSPDLLMVPATLRADGTKAVKNMLATGGESNTAYGVVDLMVSSWL